MADVNYVVGEAVELYHKDLLVWQTGVIASFEDVADVGGKRMKIIGSAAEADSWVSLSYQSRNNDAVPKSLWSMYVRRAGSWPLGQRDPAVGGPSSGGSSRTVRPHLTGGQAEITFSVLDGVFRAGIVYYNEREGVKWPTTVTFSDPVGLSVVKRAFSFIKLQHEGLAGHELTALQLYTYLQTVDKDGPHVEGLDSKVKWPTWDGAVKDVWRAAKRDVWQCFPCPDTGQAAPTVTAPGSCNNTVAPCAIGRRQVYLYLCGATTISPAAVSSYTLLTDEHIEMYFEDKKKLVDLVRTKEVAHAIFEAAGIGAERRDPFLLDVLINQLGFFAADVSILAKLKVGPGNAIAGSLGERDARLLLDPTRLDPLEQFDAMSDVMKITLLAAVALPIATNPYENYSSGLKTVRTARGIAALEDITKLRRKAAHLMTALSVMTSATQTCGGATELTPDRLLTSIDLLLGGHQGGISNRNLDNLAGRGLAVHHKRATAALRIAAKLGTAAFVFPRKFDGSRQACLELADNMDIRAFGTNHSFIVSCLINLGWAMSPKEQRDFSAGFDNMPATTLDMVPDMLMTKQDDEWLRNTTTDPRSIRALRQALALLQHGFTMEMAAGAHSQNVVDAATTARRAALVKAAEAAKTKGDDMRFQASGRRMVGKVVSVNAERRTCSISVTNSDGGSTSYDCVQLDSIDLVGETSSSIMPPVKTAFDANNPDGVDPVLLAARVKMKAPNTCLSICVTNMSSKKAEAATRMTQGIRDTTEDFYGELKGSVMMTDHEFAAPVMLQHFLRKAKILFAISGGHSAKGAVLAILKFHEFGLVAPLLRGAGINPGTTAYTRLLETCPHITDMWKHFAGIADALLTALAFSYLQANPESVKLLEKTLQHRKEEEVVEDEDEEDELHLQKFKCIILDESARPCGLAHSKSDVEVAGAFRVWARSCETPGEDCHIDLPIKMPVVSGGADEIRDGQIRDSVPEWLRYLFSLPYRDKGGVQGLVTICKAIPGLGLPRSRTKILLVEKLLAYHSCGDGDEDAKLAAAAAVTSESVVQKPKLPEVPEGGNINMRSLNTFLFDEVPPVLALMRHGRIREADGALAAELPHGCPICHTCDETCADDCDSNCCRCSHRHPCLVVAKAMLRNVFLRPQVNYQRDYVLYVMELVRIFQHESASFVNLALRHFGTVMVSQFGDNINCQYADMAQEGENIGEGKSVARRSPDNEDMVRTRVLSNSARRAMAQQAEYNPAALPQRRSKITDVMKAKEKKRNNAFFNGGLVVVGQILRASSSSQVAADQALPLHDNQRLWYRVAANDIVLRRACTGLNQGIGDGMSVSLPPPVFAPIRSAHTTMSTETTQNYRVLAQRLQRKRQKEEVSEEARGLEGRITLKDDRSMFGAQSGAGNGKSDFATVLLQLYPGPWKVHKVPGKAWSYVGERCGGVDNGGGNIVVETLDALQLNCMRVRPCMRRGYAEDVGELARAVLTVLLPKDDLPLLPNGTDVWLFFAFDAVQYITWLRVIQQLKRKKKQALAIRKAMSKGLTVETLLEDIQAGGSYPHLMADKEFLDFLVKQMAWYLVNDDPSVDWERLQGRPGVRIIGLVGGGETAVATCVKGDRDAVPFGRFTITTRDIGEAIKYVWKQGEGEAMLFALCWRLLELYVKSGGSLKDRLFVFLNKSNDVDALVLAASFATTMILLLAGEIGCVPADVGADVGPVMLLRVHPKSSMLLKKVGALLSRTGDTAAGGAPRATPNGRLLVVTVDARELVVTVELDDTLPEYSNFGERYFGLVFLFAMGVNDYNGALLKTGHGETVAAYKSRHLRKAVAATGTNLAPVTVTLAGTATGSGMFVAPTIKLDVAGGLLVWAAITALKPSTLNKIVAKHGTDFSLLTVPYDHHRAFARLGQTSPLPPPMYAVLGQMSVANVLLPHFTMYPMQLDPRPSAADADAELAGSCYAVTGRGARVDKQLLVGMPGCKRAGKPDETVVLELRGQYGNAIMDAVLPEPFPFSSPLEALIKAYKFGGCEPVTTVAANLCLPGGVMLTAAGYVEWKDSANGGIEKADFVAVFGQSLAHHTIYKDVKGGRPQFRSAKPGDLWGNREIDVAAASAAAIEAGDVMVGWVNMKAVLAAFNGPNMAAARKYTDGLLTHVLGNVDMPDYFEMDDSDDVGGDAEGEAEAEASDSNGDESDQGEGDAASDRDSADSASEEDEMSEEEEEEEEEEETAEGNAGRANKRKRGT